jgi:hypothetical protein
MKSVQIGRFRIRFGRFLRGGLCPWNVIGKHWSLIPELSKDEGPHSADLSPAGVGKTLLSLLLRVLERKREQ